MKHAPIAVRESLDLARMETVAQALGRALRPGDIVALKGEVGAGKTTFARALIRAIALAPGEVTSPTFNLMQSYDVRLAGGRVDTLWHLDLYRLKDPSEIQALGLRELFAHVMIIEWPEIIEALVAPEKLSVAFDFGERDDTRTLVFRGSPAWKERFGTMNI